MRCSMGHNCNRRAMHCRPLLHKLNSTMHIISGTLHSIPFPWLPVLSNIELPALWRKAATDKLVEKIIKYDSWPIQPDILNPPFLHWHPGHHCSWTCNQLTSKVDGGITESQQPGFDLPRHQWSLRSCFRTEQGHCGACRRRWQHTDTDLCPCGETQTTFYIVKSCPLTKLNGGLSRLHSRMKTLMQKKK